MRYPTVASLALSSSRALDTRTARLGYIGVIVAESRSSAYDSPAPDQRVGDESATAPWKPMFIGRPPSRHDETIACDGRGRRVERPWLPPQLMVTLGG